MATKRGLVWCRSNMWGTYRGHRWSCGTSLGSRPLGDLCIGRLFRANASDPANGGNRTHEAQHTRYA